MRYYIIALAGAGLLLATTPARMAHAQLGLPELPRNLPELVPDLDDERRLRRRVEDTVEETTETVNDSTESAVDAAILPLATQLAAQASNTVENALRPFQATVDPSGNAIELDTVVVLINTARIDELVHNRVILVARRDLPSLGMTMLTLRQPAGGALPELVDELRTRWPDAQVDFNHIYTTSSTSDDGSTVPLPVEQQSSADRVDELRIGVIDSAVQTEHFALRDSRIIAEDFVLHEGNRPQTHGTAVASLVTASSGNRATIYSAGVFVHVPGYQPGASTEGLIAAVEWLMSARVPVINMSLSGPANDLLEVALRRAVDKGYVVVAAVGNNGPSGEPLYPAAYDVVIGVTAVDRNNKVFRYANRGEHVDFAARGVDVRIADSNTGGFRIESGTSMAAPHVAVVIADLLRSDDVEASAAESWLIVGAEDLGRKGFDPVYGHGLVTRPPVVYSSN
ncbi:MAG: S8 family serine peptidase [Gammaproteobacteria bacterium]|nr:S8 family serine peptidase [Gammaproteobacteria bacterium]